MTGKAARLQEVVANEALLWGDAVADSYHGVADTHMDSQWDALIKPALGGIDVDMSACADFACGHGRNTMKMREAGAQLLVMIDVNAENLRRCNERFGTDVGRLNGREAEFTTPLDKAVLIDTSSGHQIYTFLCNGMDLSGIKDGSFSFFYSFDAMVHFDLEIIASYMPEFHRVMGAGAIALLHHSNYDANPGGDFRHNPHWRNFMTARIFKHLARKAGFEVLRQWTFAWGELPDSDCITVLRKP